MVKRVGLVSSRVVTMKIDLVQESSLLIASPLLQEGAP